MARAQQVRSSEHDLRDSDDSARRAILECESPTADFSKLAITQGAERDPSSRAPKDVQVAHAP